MLLHEERQECGRPASPAPSRSLILAPLASLLKQEVLLVMERSRRLFLGPGATFLWPAHLSDTLRCSHISAISSPPPLPALFNHVVSARAESVFAEWAVEERRRDGGRERKGAQGGVEVVI